MKEHRNSPHVVNSIKLQIQDTREAASGTSRRAAVSRNFMKTQRKETIIKAKQKETGEMAWWARTLAAQGMRA